MALRNSVNGSLPSVKVEDRQKLLLAQDHSGSLQHMQVLMSVNASPSRRLSHLPGSGERLVQHSRKVLAQYFEEDDNRDDDKEEEPSLSTCSLSSAASSLDEAAPRLADAPMSPIRPVFALEQGNCHSPYFMDRSAVISPRHAAEEEQQQQQQQQQLTTEQHSVLSPGSVSSGKENETAPPVSSLEAARSTLVRRKSRNVLQKLKRGFRKSEQPAPDENELPEDEMSQAVEALRREVAAAEERVAQAERNVMATLRSEKERLEMRLRMLQGDIETRHVISDSLSKQQALQQSRRYAALRPAVTVQRGRHLEETLMRSWTVLPQPALHVVCPGSRVRTWLGGQAQQLLARGSTELSNQIVFCCVLQYLTADDISSLKRCSRLLYNICSLFFRSKPVSDLAVELLNSEAVYNVFLKSFLTDYRDVVASRCPAVDLAPVFGPVEKICSLSSRMLTLLNSALATDRPFCSDVAHTFISTIEDVEKEYSSYCESYHLARAASESMLASKGVLEALGSDVKALTLDSFLIMPVQRVPRYLLMLQSMLRKTPVAQQQNLIEAVDLLQRCAAGINTRMQEAEDASKLAAVLASIADVPSLGSSKLVSQDAVSVGGRSALLVLLSDRVLVALRNGGKSTVALTATWRFKSQHMLQSCHARLYDDPKAAKLQIMLEDAETLLCTFESEEKVRAWLSNFSFHLVDQLKYHPRSSKLFKLSAPRMQLTRFCMADGEVLVRPVHPRVTSVSQQHVFVLDAENKLFVFAGRGSSAAEQAAAEQYVQTILAESDTRALSVVRTEEDKKGSEQFFELLGGDASLVSKSNIQTEAPPHLSVFQDGVPYPRPSLFGFSSLPDTGCALVDARYGPVFVWAALRSSPSLRDRAIRFAQDTYSSQPDRTIEFVLAGGEPALFKMLFSDWPGKRISGTVQPAVVVKEETTSATLSRRKGILFRSKKNVQ